MNNKNFNVLYISKHFIITDHTGKKFKITNITNDKIILNDKLIYTYNNFKKYFNIEKIVIY